MRFSLISALVLATACSDVELQRVDGGVDADPNRALAPLGLLGKKYERPWEKRSILVNAPPEAGGEGTEFPDNRGPGEGPTDNRGPGEGPNDPGTEEEPSEGGSGEEVEEGPVDQPESNHEDPGSNVPDPGGAGGEGASEEVPEPEANTPENPVDTINNPGRQTPTHEGSPLALVVVLDISPAMAANKESLRAAAAATTKALRAESNPRDQILVLAHVDRRVHVLADPASGIGRLDELSVLGTTCSTHLDPTWDVVGYQNPVPHSPACWSDELGSDVSNPLWVARAWFGESAPSDAIRGVIWVGSGQVASLGAMSSRPEGMPDAWPATIRHLGHASTELLFEAARSEAQALALDDVSIFAFGVGPSADGQLLDIVAQGLGFGEVLAGASAVDAEVQRAVFLLRDQ